MTIINLCDTYKPGIREDENPKMAQRINRVNRNIRMILKQAKANS